MDLWQPRALDTKVVFSHQGYGNPTIDLYVAFFKVSFIEMSSFYGQIYLIMIFLNGDVLHAPRTIFYTVCNLVSYFIYEYFSYYFFKLG